MLKSIALLVGGTFASEDLTCVTAGQLIAAGAMHPVTGIAGCALGIFIGDMGLWLIGAILGRSHWITRRLPASRVERARTWLAKNTPAAILVSRFVPGSRVPLYVAAGAMRQHVGRFALWTLVAALIWTPLVVLTVAIVGETLVTRFLGRSWLALGVAIAASFVLLKLVSELSSEIGRAKWVARFSRIWRWEFWPMWLFYLPVIPWIVWLSLRHRSFMTITAANPGIPHGGFVGESKYQIMSAMRHEMVAPTMLVETVDQLDQLSWEYPIILKPDVGQRGAGVRLIHSRDAAVEYIRQSKQALIAQPFHPGPFEAGIFYYRIPGEPRGHILSITDKHFAQLVGDGAATIEQLIWRHPRFRMQAGTFLQRHHAQRHRVLAAGETFRLAVAGNHCQGTEFRDGSHFITPQLEATIDQIARSLDGFFFGRFDVRYRDVEALKRGEELCVIELNGVTSESTNIYDPSWSVIRAWRTLMRQWSILFRIGATNRRLGMRAYPLHRLARDVLHHFRHPAPIRLSD